MGTQLGEVELKFATDIWFSQGDEEAFFQWLYWIPGYVTCKGVGRVLSVWYSVETVTESSIAELVALFRRFDVPHIQQLRAFESAGVGAWFSDPDQCWHDWVFGSGSRLDGAD